MASTFWYSNQNIPETWTQETAWYQIRIGDSLVQRTRLLEIWISNPRNIKQSVYTAYRRVKILEAGTGSVIFLGRVIESNPEYSDQYGQVLKIHCSDYGSELFERKVNTDYSGTPRTRSALISGLVLDYTYSGNITLNIQESGTSGTIYKNYVNSNQTPAQIIENLAEEDYWTESVFNAFWKWAGDVNWSTVNSWYIWSFNEDKFYFGHQNNPFLGINFNVTDLGAAHDIHWEYWNGSAWQNLTMLETPDFTISPGTAIWELPVDWKQVAITSTFPHTGSPPNLTSRYWIRLYCTSGPTIDPLTFNVTCRQGVGYDYYVNDNQVFNYFRRGSKPNIISGNYLTIQLGVVESIATRAMTHEYSFSDQPKELTTRVTSYGTANDGTTISYTATNSSLEFILGTIKEFNDFVWGSNMTSGQLYTYVQNRATALLNTRGDVTSSKAFITRGKVNFYRYPYVGASQNLVRVGDICKIICSPQSIDDYFLILAVNYDEPPAITKMEVVSLIYGRGLSPFDLSNVLQGLSAGGNVIIPSAKIGDLIVGTAKIADLSVTNAKIANVAADKITAGNILVSLTLNSGGQLNTGNRIMITPNEIAGYNTASTKQFYLQAIDGKAYAAGGKVVLDNGGVVIRGSGNLAFTNLSGTNPAYIWFQDGEFAIQLTWGDIYLRPMNYILLYGSLADDEPGHLHLLDTIEPRYSGSVFGGLSSQKWSFIYYTNLVACPLPTSNSAWGIYKKIPSPIYRVGDYGMRHYFDIDDFPDEMKVKDYNNVSDIEITRVVGVTVQAVRELIDRVEKLEEKI